MHVARSKSQPFAARHPSAQPATGRPLRSSGGLVLVCADRGGPPSLSLPPPPSLRRTRRRAGAPRLHQTDGCAVLGLEPSFGSARRLGSAASMDVRVSPVRGLRPLRLLWLSSEKMREGRRPPLGGRPRGLCQRSPAGIRFRWASWRLGAKELIRAAEEGCALERKRGPGCRISGSPLAWPPMVGGEASASRWRAFSSSDGPDEVTCRCGHRPLEGDRLPAGAAGPGR